MKKEKKQRPIKTRKWECHHCGNRWEANRAVYSGRCPNEDCKRLVWV